MTQTNNSYFIKKLLTLVFPIAFQHLCLPWSAPLMR